MFRVSLFPPRFYVFGRRLHHGIPALLWLLSDLHDVAKWIPDLLRHPDAR